MEVGVSRLFLSVEIFIHCRYNRRREIWICGENEMVIEINRDIEGSILDIGGGGECVIGQIYGDTVIAIDNSQDELDEAPNCCEKRLIDATTLSFSDDSFDNVTFFYSLMYMTSDIQQDSISEAVRVLKAGGMVYIWDTSIESACPDAHVVDRDIRAGQLNIPVSYGIIKNESQNAESILQLLKTAGFLTISITNKNGQFYIVAKKSR